MVYSRYSNIAVIGLIIRLIKAIAKENLSVEFAKFKKLLVVKRPKHNASFKMVKRKKNISEVWAIEDCLELKAQSQTRMTRKLEKM